jgi:hypothetical protein
MAQEFFAGLAQFAIAESSDEEDSPRYATAPEQSHYGERSVCFEPSIFGGHGFSVFEPSVCEPSHYGERSVLEQSYFGERSVLEDSYFSGSLSNGPRTSYIQRAAAAPPPEQVAVAAPAMSLPSGLPYQPRLEDQVDMAVAEYFRTNPAVFSRNRGFARVRPGVYLANGREISVDLLHTRTTWKGPKFRLMVKDGPLRQPLADYLENKDTTAEYSGSVFKAQNAVQAIPQGCRMTFCDAGGNYSSRLEAMKLAKEQAIVREEAATAMHQGKAVNPEIKAKYEKKTGNVMKNLSFMSTASGVSQISTVTMPVNAGRRAPVGAGCRSPRPIIVNM